MGLDRATLGSDASALTPRLSSSSVKEKERKDERRQTSAGKVDGWWVSEIDRDKEQRLFFMFIINVRTSHTPSPSASAGSKDADRDRETEREMKGRKRESNCQSTRNESVSENRGSKHTSVKTPGGLL